LKVYWNVLALLQSIPNRTSPEIEEKIIKYREKHPRWGREKIWKLLHKDFHQETLPSVSTVNRIIKNNGLVIPRKRRPRVTPVYPIFDPRACNEVWSADFKGNLAY